MYVDEDIVVLSCDGLDFDYIDLKNQSYPIFNTDDEKNYIAARNHLLGKRVQRIVCKGFNEKIAQILDGAYTAESIVYIKKSKSSSVYIINEITQSATRDQSSIVFPYSYRNLLNEITGNSQNRSYKTIRISNQPLPQPETRIKTLGFSEQPLLTIAMSSYNVRNYILNGIASIKRQPYTNDIEVIVVDDGSTDDSVKVVKQFNTFLEKQGVRSIKIIKKRNGGHGSTINEAVKAASGKYFRLLDADDYYSTPNFMAFLEQLKDCSSDLVLSDYTEDVLSPYHFNAVSPYRESLSSKKARPVSRVAFPGVGPLLATTTIKTKLLQANHELIDEKSFYVDMEYNFINYSISDTISYIPENIYIYLIGRKNQSMAIESMKKRWKDHERVTSWLLAHYSNLPANTSAGKKEHLLKNIVLPMVRSQYMITTEYLASPSAFRSFDTILSTYPKIYNDPSVAGNRIKLHRLTKGLSVPISPAVLNAKQFICRFTSNSYNR